MWRHGYNWRNTLFFFMQVICDHVWLIPHSAPNRPFLTYFAFCITKDTFSFKNVFLFKHLIKSEIQKYYSTTTSAHPHDFLSHQHFTLHITHSVTFCSHKKVWLLQLSNFQASAALFYFLGLQTKMVSLFWTESKNSVSLQTSKKIIFKTCFFKKKKNTCLLKYFLQHDPLLACYHSLE